METNGTTKIKVAPHCANCSAVHDLEDGMFVYDWDNNVLYCDSHCAFQHLNLEDCDVIDAEWEVWE